MADIKKISELSPTNNVGASEFVVVDKDTGKSKRVPLSKLQDYIKKEGQKGIRGSQGDSGEKGEKGLKGFKGSPEAKGEKGFAGEEGDKGFKGQKGIKGTKGRKGDKGKQAAFFQLEANRGETGDLGEAGDVATPTIANKGIKGNPGTNAEKGEIGLDGDRGDLGPSQLKGNKGPKGTKGIKGIPGKTAQDIGSLANGALGAKGSKGVKGNKGSKGSKGPKGPKGPQGLKGSKGVPGIPGSKSQWIWPAWIKEGTNANIDGLHLETGACVPRWSEDDFLPIPTSVGRMSGQYKQNKFTKVGGPRNGAWDSGVYSQQTINTSVKKIAILTIVPNRVDCVYSFGFTNQNPNSFNSPPTTKHLDYAFYFTQGGSTGLREGYGIWQVKQNDVLQTWPDTNPPATIVGIYRVGMAFQLIWDGVNNKITWNCPGGSLGTGGTQKNYAAKTVNCKYGQNTVFRVSSSFYFPAQSQTRFVTLRTG